MANPPDGSPIDQSRDFMVRQLTPGSAVVAVRGEFAPSISLDLISTDGRELRVYMASDSAYQLLEELPALLVQASEDARRRMAGE